MRRLYRALIESPRAVVVVADRSGEPIGFVAGVADTGEFYRHFAKRHGIAAGMSALPALIRPSTLRRAWETLRYGADDSDVAAELLSMAVSPGSRRLGIGARLGAEFLSALGEPEVRVIVGAANRGAIRSYERLGFVPAGTREVHAGAASVELMWRASS